VTTKLITGAESGLNDVGIADVQLRDLVVHGDERGRVFEGWRAEWTDWPAKQLTEARAQAGVMKGLHLHYRQWDWWRCIRGRMLVGLYDARPGSPTHGAAAQFEMNPDAPQALAIPPGVAHGFYVLEDIEMIYLLSETYDPGDEFGIRYDTVGLEWPDADPVLSARDVNLPALPDFAWEGP
jgi:dTDP-4-dehydrorhamnose 3,5-epimerase